MNQLYKNCNEVKKWIHWRPDKDWIKSSAFIFWVQNQMWWCGVRTAVFVFVTYGTRELYLSIHQRVSFYYVFQCSIKLQNTSCIYLLIFLDFYLIVTLNKNSTVKAYLERSSISKLYLAATPVLKDYHQFKE